ncbi:hypothetical protein D5086_026080 [Populus alba]|uniref:Uncharacterized protein n=1 Tax=Populus alba TaxID=43335 RepID=A0ACC4B1F3_POPAL
MSIAGSSNGTHHTPLFRISNKYNLGLKLSFVTRKKRATGGEGPTAKQDYECLIKMEQGNQKNFDREQKTLRYVSRNSSSGKRKDHDLTKPQDSRSARIGKSRP